MESIIGSTASGTAMGRPGNARTNSSASARPNRTSASEATLMNWIALTKLVPNSPSAMTDR
ncbi:hypothetical protein HDG37_000990 [Paraburkholderia sp. MM5384-R2]|nr:hypothetical protein [Paraburkholderia sp. MM5384-R2]